MSSEIEIKAKIDSVKDFERRIVELGGMFLMELEQLDIYYRHPCRDMKASDEAIRVRCEGASALLTYKGKKEGGGVKAREEIEVGLSSFEGGKAILERLGFREVASVFKDRKIFSLNIKGIEFEIALDSVKGLGSYIEIEAKSEAGGEGAHGEKVKELLMEIADALSIEEDKMTTKSYLELLEEESSS